MEMIDQEKEKKEILKRYRRLMKALRPKLEKGDREMVRKAFELALEQHKDMRRKSGEPYIYHPLEVAQIVIDDIQLGPTSVVCALLHDVVEDTDITLEDIKTLFGQKVMSIIDGLTKISGVVLDDSNASVQAENFRKMLLTLSDDVRVILIKLADRLHNMRTLDSMKKDKQLKIASETLYLYAPLAHRLGLYSIKTELEDLCLKFKEPEAYFEIKNQLLNSEKERMSYINHFSLPIINSLNDKGFKFNIKSRTKSIYSIWSKMKKQNIPFEEVYDIFAIRIIIDVPFEEEKSACWAVYSVVTDFYKSNPDRLRDWINTPKSNGYESLHTTVMGKGGKWVEVQIRSSRMDEIAEKGYAAHWKYKDKDKSAAQIQENAIEEWLKRIREILENPDINTVEFIDDFKLNLFAEEIYLFTPKGAMKTLPAGSTVLDFAFEIHSQLGLKCIGGKINNKLVPYSHKLKSGEQVEILVSDIQKPKEEWLKNVVTARAKTKLKEYFREERRGYENTGKEILEKKLKTLKIFPTESNISKIANYFKAGSPADLYYRIGINAIELKNLKSIVVVDEKLGTRSLVLPKTEKKIEDVVQQVRGNKDMLVLDENMNNLDYSIAPCCNPIRGDEVFGFITDDKKIQIHRTNCDNAIKLMSNFAYRIIKAKWTDTEKISFLAGIKLSGTDDVGLVNKITNIISSEYNVNMRSIKFDTEDGLFSGEIFVYVQDTLHLTELIKKLRKVTGVHEARRI